MKTLLCHPRYPPVWVAAVIQVIKEYTKFNNARKANNCQYYPDLRRVGSDGSILLLEVGRLEALGKSINELRSEVRNILIRNGISPKFQLELALFNHKSLHHHHIELMAGAQVLAKLFH